MRYRAIQSTVAASETLASVSDFAERLYWRLLAQTDPWGRLPGSVTKVRAMCIPLLTRRDSQIEAALDELQGVGRIERDDVVIQLRDFDENQPAEFTRRRGPSKYPAPAPQRNSGTLRDTPGHSGLEEKRREENQKADKSASSTSVSTADAATRIYNHWRAVRSKSDRRYDRVSPARRQKVQARLREFPESELIRCIDAVALDPWEDRSRHDDLTIIFRSREQVDRFLAFSDERKAVENGSASSRTQQHLARLKAEGKL